MHCSQKKKSHMYPVSALLHSVHITPQAREWLKNCVKNCSQIYKILCCRQRYWILGLCDFGLRAPITYSCPRTNFGNCKIINHLSKVYEWILHSAYSWVSKQDICFQSHHGLLWIFYAWKTLGALTVFEPWIVPPVSGELQLVLYPHKWGTK